MGRLTMGVFVLALALLAGCGTVFEETVTEPEFDLRETALLIPPFAEGKLWHYESTPGDRLARLVSLSLQDACDSALVDDGYVARQVMTEFADPAPWGLWARKCGATHALIGSIRDLHFGAGEVLGLVQGRLVVEVEVWGAKDDQLLYTSPPIQITFPENPDQDPGIGLSRNDITDRLMAKAAQRVAALVCGETRGIFSR
ncbi:MAG: hypothetical protein AB7O52_06540 [Planctomycetota bacterium]